MKPFYFLFLSVVVAMGQTPLDTPFGLTITGGRSVAEQCTRTITFGSTTKTIKELFPEECATKEHPYSSCHWISGYEPQCECLPVGATSIVSSASVTPILPAPKLESAEPPTWPTAAKISFTFIGDQEGDLVEPDGWYRCSDGKRLGWCPPKPETDWQAIADHCHIETLNNGFLGDLTPPPNGRGWEAMTGMRIVCK
jgi:hypothetical protein